MSDWRNASIRKNIQVDSLILCRGQCVKIYLNGGTKNSPIQELVELRVHESGRLEIFCDLSKIDIQHPDFWTKEVEMAKEEQNG